MTPVLSHYAALVYTLVVTSAAEGDMSDAELHAIGEMILTLPAFDGYDKDKLLKDAGDCAAILENEEDGLDTVLGLIKQALPANLRETAYALACEIAAADRGVTQEELRILELLRHGLEIDRLHAAAIERGTRARYAKP